MNYQSKLQTSELAVYQTPAQRRLGKFKRRMSYLLLAGILFAIISLEHSDKKPQPGLNKGNLFPIDEITSTDGRRFSLSDYTGKLLFIEFWNGNSAGFRFSQPLFDELFSKTQPSDNKDIAVVSISTDLSESVFRNIKSGLTYKDLILHCKPSDRTRLDTFLPGNNFLIDGNGQIIAKNVDPETLEKLLKSYRK